MPKKPSKAIFGVLGFPVSHSLSPAMHNAALRKLKAKANYKKFEVRPEELPGFIKGLAARNIRGLNVTIPYKEKVLDYLKAPLNPAVGNIGAANTLLLDKDGGIKGYNTDHLGFSRHLSELKVRPKRAAVIGAGGAAKAVVFALAKKGAEEVSIYDIDSYRSISLMRRFRDLFPGCLFTAAESIEALSLKGKDLLVNCSPVGMKPQDPCLISSNMLPEGIFVYDLIYNPSETKLLKLAASKGLSCANGLGMLLYQGAESFNIWMKPKKAPVAVMYEALKKAIDSSILKS